MRRLAGNAMALAAGGVAAQAAFLGIEAFIARRLGVESYGIFSAAFAYGLVLVLLLDMGMNSRMLQEATRDPESVGHNFGTMLALKMGAFIVLYPLGLGLFSLIGYDAAFLEVFAIIAFYALIITCQDTLSSVYSARQRMQVNAFFQASVPIATLVLLLVFGQAGIGLTGIAALYVLAVALVTTTWFAMAWRGVRPVRFDARHIRTIVHGSYLYGVTALVSQTSFRSGVILLSLMRDEVEVAVFAAAFRIVDVGYKLPLLATRVMTPRLFADRFHAPETYEKTCLLLLRLATVASGAMGVLLLIVGSDLAMLLFGDEFGASGLLLEILGVSLALKMFSVLGQTVLVTAEDHAFRARMVGIAALLGLSLSVPLILWLGALGAAIGVVAADVFVLLVLVYRLRLLLPGFGILTAIGIPLLAATAAAVTGMVLSAPPLVAALAALMVYGALLLATGYLRPALAVLR